MMFRMLGFLIGLAALIQPAHAAYDLLRCQAKDAITFQDDGSLAKDRVALSWQRLYDEFIVDISTGVVRMKDAVPSHFAIVQRGDGANDTVLVFESKFSASGYAWPTVVRIRQWKDVEPILFRWFDLSYLVTGTCEPVL